MISKPLGRSASVSMARDTSGSGRGVGLGVNVGLGVIVGVDEGVGVRVLVGVGVARNGIFAELHAKDVNNKPKSAYKIDAVVLLTFMTISS